MWLMLSRPWVPRQAVAACFILLAGCNDASLMYTVPEKVDLLSPLPGDADLAGVDFAGVDFAGADLTSAPVDQGGDDAMPVPPDLDVDALPSGVAQGPCHGCAWHRGVARCWGANG